MLFDATALELVIMWSDVSSSKEVGAYASSTSQSSSTTVRSRIKLFVVSTTSWKMTHPVDGWRVNMTEEGWTCRIWRELTISRAAQAGTYCSFTGTSVRAVRQHARRVL